MEFHQAQQKIKNHFETSGFAVWPRFVVLARLNEEVAEIGRIISVKEGYREAWKIDNMDAEDEFGDALFQLLHLANLCDVDAEKAMQRVLKKYEKYVKK